MRSRLSIRSGIELAAMVDIVFLLVTYFLINATLSHKPAIKIDLPKSETARPELEQNLIVYVNNKNEIFLNDQKVSLKNLPKLIKQKAKKLKKDHVIIKGDKKANYQTIVSVMDHISKAGIKKFNLATDK